jgi:peptidoglycan hydrolase CwlO-like protein
MKESLIEQLQKATDFLEQREAELSDFQNKMTAAVNGADSKMMLDLKRRRNELPTEIELARIQIAKLQLELDESRLPELQEAVSKFKEPIEEAVAKRDLAVLELGRLQGEYHQTNEDFRDLRMRVGERKRELSRLIHLASH